MNEITLRPVGGPIDETVCLPGSKSLTNRVLMAAALAGGRSQIEGILIADDTERMIAALEVLGVKTQIDRDRHVAQVHGCGGFWPNSYGEIDCGAAGTVMRFITAGCAVGQGDYRVDGSPRMRVRPMRELIDALRSLGALIECPVTEGFCPLVVHARGLRGGEVRIDRPVSSQFVSALLLAAPRALRDVLIEVQGALPSAPYVRMTMQVMESFGVSLVEDAMRRFIVPAGQMYSPTTFRVEADASTASYFFAAAALTGGRVTVEGIGEESCQGDIGFVGVLEQMGCHAERGRNHTTVFGPAEGRLRGVDVDLGEMPDVVQTLAVAAAFAEGPTRIRNVANLRVKETDRLFALSRELGHLRVPTEILEDGIVIKPEGQPVAGIIDTHDDHRMAMSFALAGLRVDGVVIRDPGCVNKSFPEFFEMWSRLGR